MNKEDEKVLQPKIASREVTMHILKAFGLRMSKKLGQNFLIDARIVQGIVDAAEVKPGDRVLEIGPGIGTLTQGLAEAGADVTAVELDKKLPAVLKETLKAYDNVRIVPGDILKVNIPEIMGEAPFKVAANLPYYITSPILMRLLEEKLPIRNITVMVQKEAAQRLCAAPGTRDAGAISYAVAYYAEPKLLFSVQPGSFYPAPKVTSAVIRLDVREKPAVTVPNGDESAFFALIRAAFSQRRKTAANAIANGLHLPKAQVISALQAAGLDERSRPEQLTLENYCALQTALANT